MPGLNKFLITHTSSVSIPLFIAHVDMKKSTVLVASWVGSLYSLLNCFMLSIIEWYLAVFFCACWRMAETWPKIREKRMAEGKYSSVISALNHLYLPPWTIILEALDTWLLDGTSSPVQCLQNEGAAARKSNFCSLLKIAKGERGRRQGVSRLLSEVVVCPSSITSLDFLLCHKSTLAYSRRPRAKWKVERTKTDLYWENNLGKDF